MGDEKKDSEIISIVVPAYNSSRTIGSVIDALGAQNLPAGKPEIIIVDDGSTDNTADIVKSYPAVKYVYQQNVGPSAARNTGWKQAKGRIVCFTDSDCLPEKDWVSKILSHYTSGAIGGVGGSYDINNEKSILAKLIHEEIAYRHSKMPREVDYLGTFNVSYRRDILERIGGFDTAYKAASGEDNDLAYKVKSLGYKLIFDKDIKVAHNYPESLLKYLKQQLVHGLWRVKLYLIHPRMIKGDCYSSLFDYAQPILALFTVVLSFFIIFQGVFKYIAGTVILLFALQLPMPVLIALKKRSPEYLLLAALMFIRSYARGLGMLCGSILFTFRRK